MDMADLSDQKEGSATLLQVVPSRCSILVSRVGAPSVETTTLEAMSVSGPVFP